MFGLDGFRSGRSLPALIVVLLIVIAAGLYIRFQFGKVERAITSPNASTIPAAAAATIVVGEPQPVAISAQPVQREATVAQHAADASPDSQPGQIQPDRPVGPDNPLPQ